jgi:hypothetical protein
LNQEAVPNVRHISCQHQYIPELSLEACVNACCYVSGCDGYLYCSSSYVSEFRSGGRGKWRG